MLKFINLLVQNAKIIKSGSNNLYRRPNVYFSLFKLRSMIKGTSHIFTLHLSYGVWRLWKATVVVCR